MEIINQIQDVYDKKYIGRVISKEPFLGLPNPFRLFVHVFDKYYLQIINSETGEYKSKKIGEKICTPGSSIATSFFDDIRIDKFGITKRGLEAEVTKVSSAFGEIKTKTYFIPLEKFPN